MTAPVTLKATLAGVRDARSPYPSISPAGIGSGGWIRTNDLWVMSPASCHCSTPRHASILAQPTAGYNPHPVGETVEWEDLWVHLSDERGFVSCTALEWG